MWPVAPRRPFHQDGRPDQQEEEGDVLGRDISLITAPLDKKLCLEIYKGAVVQGLAWKWRRVVREAGKRACGMTGPAMCSCCGAAPGRTKGDT